MKMRDDASLEPAIRIRRTGRFREFLEDNASAAGVAEHGLHPGGMALGLDAECAKKIVAVSSDAEFPEALIGQALGLADRIGLVLVGLSIGPADAGGDDAHAAKRREFFEAKAEASARTFARKAAEAGVAFHHVLRFGPVGPVLEKECARLKRVEFVLAVKQQRGRDGYHPSMPLFEVTG